MKFLSMAYLIRIEEDWKRCPLVLVLYPTYFLWGALLALLTEPIRLLRPAFYVVALKVFIAAMDGTFVGLPFKKEKL